MTDPEGPADPTDATEASPPRPRRKHRRVTRPATNQEAEPAQGQSSDDTATAWGESDEDLDRARWLREQRPPHWG